MMAVDVASIIRHNLEANNVQTHFMLYPTDSILDKNTLCLRFTLLGLAYVTWHRGIKSDIIPYIAVRITQIEPETKSPKRGINTVVRIAVDNFADNLEIFGIDFTKNLLKHFNVPRPYKEFRFSTESDEKIND